MACKQSLICAYFSPHSVVFSGESNIMDRGIIAKSNSLKLECLNDGFVSYQQLFTSQNVLMNWSGVDYLWIIVMFLSDV